MLTSLLSEWPSHCHAFVNSFFSTYWFWSNIGDHPLFQTGRENNCYIAIRMRTHSLVHLLSGWTSSAASFSPGQCHASGWGTCTRGAGTCEELLTQGRAPVPSGGGAALHSSPGGDYRWAWPCPIPTSQPCTRCGGWGPGTGALALNHCPRVLAKERGKSPLNHGGVPLQPALTPSWLAPLVAMWRCHIPACQLVFWKASSQPSLRVWVTDLHKEVIHSLQIYCQFCYA